MSTTYKFETESILTSNTTTFTFSNLSSYSATDLEINFALRGSNKTATVNLFVRINGDTTSIYNWGNFLFNGVSRTVSNFVNDPAWSYASAPGDNAPVTDFCFGRLYLPEYKESNTRKPMLMDIMNPQTSAGNISTFFGGGNLNTTVNAINSISFSFSAGSVATGSRAAIYSINRNA